MSIDEQALVRYVYDGDTIHLKDRRKIRLIGINTPERARDDRPAESFAKDARSALASAISQSDSKVGLIYGRQRLDRYQRTLAHLVAVNGDNLQQALLSQGLAVAITFPPNDAFSDCYRATERAARCDKRGIWSRLDEAIVPANELGSGRGFHVVSGTIDHVSQTAKGIWLFTAKLMIGIRSENLDAFNQKELFALKGKQVIVRGWVNPKKPDKNKAGKSKRQVRHYMRVRHPSSIEVNTPDRCYGNTD